MPQNLQALLDHLKPLYPRGVPRRFIKKEAGEKLLRPLWRGRETAALLFIRCGQVENVWEGAEGELFKAAIEKGLKTELSEVSVLGVETAALADARGLKAELEAEMKSFSPRCVMVLGAQAGSALGCGIEAGSNWFESGGTPLVVTHALADVAADLKKKKEFWFDLVAVMDKIGKKKNHEK